MKKKYSKTILPSVMITCLALVFLAGSSVCASAQDSGNDYGRYSIEFRDEQLPAALKRLEKVTGYNMLFTYEDISTYRITRKFTRSSLKDILDGILNGLELSYIFNGKNVTIIKKDAPRENETIRRLPATGYVKDEIGALPDVTVLIKGTNTGTLTDKNGYFSLGKIPVNTVLLFTMMGMKDVEVTFTGQEQIMVEMQMNSDELEATVVTGIFTRKKDSYTGAVQTVTSDEIKRVGNQNVLQSLKSIDPSLLVVANLQEGSNPNSIASMQLRGASSFNMESTTSLKSNFVSDVNQPLFILDGFETTVEKIQDMDMNRVESITILKDASAKAIYGSKAGNGVIVIETKSLRNDQTAVTYTGSCDIEIPDLSSYNLCNALEKLEIERREGFYSLSSATPAELQNISDLYSERYRRALAGESTYWLSKPLRLGIGQKHSLSIELGSKDLKSITDISYNNTQGTMKGSFRKVLSGDMNLSYRRGNWTFRNIMSIANMNNSDSPYGTFDTYASLNPYYNPYDEEGNLVSGFNSGDDALVMYKSASANSLQGYVGNPLYDATLNLKLTSEYLNFTNNTYIEWQVAKPIKIVGRFGINTQKTGSEEFYPAAHSRFKTLSSSYYGKDGTYEMSDGYYNSYSGDVSAQFNHKFTEDHSLFATAQYSISQTSYGEVTNYAEGFPNSHMNSIIFAREYASDHTPTGAYGLNRNLGILLTSGYSYKDKYMLDATIKASASSVFGTNNRWGTFWSAGVAWNAHKEDFLKDMAGNWLEQLKFRFSLGSSGNQNYTTNNSLPVYQYSNYYYNGFTGAMLQNMENPYLGWEQKMDYNLGADIKTKQVTFTVDAYISDTDNLVFSRSILPSTGFTSVSDNLGKVRNKGIEAGGSWTIIQKGTSYLSIFAKVIFNDNRILQISDALRNYNQQQQEQAESSKSTTPVIQYYDGAPLNSIWAVQSLGIDPKTGKEIFLDKDGNMTDTWSASDLILCGSSDPLYNGNFGFNGEIKGFGLNAVFSYYGGGYLYNSTLVNKVENVYIGENVDRRIYNGRWYYEGQVAQYRNGYSSPTQATTRFVQHNNVLDISSLTAYYEFPYKTISKANLSRLRLSAYVNDLYTFSSIQIERGTSYPYARTVSLSVSATF
jgi:TonB-linked SusC/RagA family outer membrane protein